jgi:hypothetical protein
VTARPCRHLTDVGRVVNVAMRRRVVLNEISEGAVS